MTEDTSQPPAPQPGWVATVTLTYDLRDGPWDRVRFPSGWVAQIDAETTKVLDWKPPPPPPWEPVVGEQAHWRSLSQPVTVGAIYKHLALVESLSGGVHEAHISDLSPPKGGAA